MVIFNPFISARIFTDFGLTLLEGRGHGSQPSYLGTLLGVQDYKKVKFPG